MAAAVPGALPLHGGAAAAGRHPTDPSDLTVSEPPHPASAGAGEGVAARPREPSWRERLAGSVFFFQNQVRK